MVRATEIVIIAKVQNQASAQLRRIARDVGGLGEASKLANRMQQNMRQQQMQAGRLAATGARQRETQLRHTERMLQLERDLTVNETTRLRLQQRLAATGTKTNAQLQRRQLLLRMIQATDERDAVLAQRRLLYEEQISNATARQTLELRMQRGEMARLLAEQRAMAAAQKLQGAQSVARGVAHIGRAATFGGLLSTAGFAAASKSYADFSTLVTKASTQIEGNADKGVKAIMDSTVRLESAIKRQMQIFPASQTEMADALYQLYSAMSVSEKGGIDLLRTTNRVSVAFGSDMPTATNVLITTLNNFKNSSGGVEATLDDLAAIVRVGRMELSDFDAMMNAVAPSAAGAGYSLKQMGGAMAAVTRLIPSQERAATGLARLIDIFANRDFQAGMAKAQRPIVDATGNLIPFYDIIQKIVSLKPSGQGLQNFIQIMTASGRGTGQGITGQANARRVLQQLVVHWDQLHDAQMQVNESQGEFNQRFKAMMQTPGVQWAIFINQLKMLALEIGQDALPAIVKLMNFIRGLIDRWRELSPELRHNIVFFTAMAGVVMLVLGPIVTLLGSVASMIIAFKLLSATMGVAGGAGTIGRLGMMLTLLSRLALIGTIAITIKLVMDKTGVSGFLKNVEGWLSDHGVKGFEKLDQALGFDTNADNEKPFFNPKAKLFGTPAEKKNAQEMLDGINKARQGTDKYTLALVNGKKEVIASIKNGMLMKDIMAQVGDQLDGTSVKQKQYNDELKQWNAQRADIIRNAHEEYQSIIDRAVDNMIAKYQEFQQANESAFGSLFQGPLLTGESFQTAQEWGISPTIGIINKDLSQQIGAFNKWKGDLNDIAKRGAPKKLVTELTQLGPDAADKIQVLAKASPKQFNRFIALWRQKQKVIQRATKQDFNQQLKEWESHGKNMGLKIIAGLESQGGALERTMRNILKNSFNGDLLNEIVNKALGDFMRDHPVPERPAGTKQLPTAGTTTTGGRHAIPIGQMNLAQVTRALKRDAPRLRGVNNALISLAHWVTQPGSAGGTDITAGERADLDKLARQRTTLARRVRRERRRRRRLMRHSNNLASTQTQNANNGMVGYQPMPENSQYIQVNINTKGEPTVVAARRAAFIVAQKAKRA